MILGLTKYPPLAIEEYAKANCKFVTNIDCPIEALAKSLELLL